MQAQGLEKLVVKAGVPEACAYEEGNFDHLAPTYNKDTNVVTLNGEEYRYAGNGELDKDEDGVKETLIKGFIHRNDSNKRITMYITDGETWGWGVFGDCQARHEPSDVNYSISDFDGKPGYDRHFDTIEDFPLPDRFDV